jgi:hypothetical protein
VYVAAPGGASDAVWPAQTRERLAEVAELAGIATGDPPGSPNCRPERLRTRRLDDGQRVLNLDETIPEMSANMTS